MSSTRTLLVLLLALLLSVPAQAQEPSEDESEAPQENPESSTTYRVVNQTGLLVDDLGEGIHIGGGPGGGLDIESEPIKQVCKWITIPILCQHCDSGPTNDPELDPARGSIPIPWVSHDHQWYQLCAG